MLLGAPFLVGCSTTGGGTTASAEADDKVVASSLAAEQDAELAGVAEIAPNAYAGGAPSPALTAFEESGAVRAVEAQSAELDGLIAKYAALYGVPVGLVRRVVERESNFNPAAQNRIYWGLMQIRHDTARTMGYRGPASGLLDAETNLKYAVKYLRGAYITAGGNEDRAVGFYASGYYYDAKRKGLLEETGLRS
ncbi:lytic transglycosylase domain-containing protein [Chelativorans salis]|uniref:Lytic transglycosylase domain-containing protein n=1 Tax=Chelativorans salis TaxID=2978478 RepID=A0ABT2LJW8_9HYPH|nr:lytic transglycosylase domain-containing protein [Chelativorans sp. EGI FJ00035]MCT7374891.1 lytic transglycosylase domain-containing protein [Chelativorans sp. EGI FJ00035]